MKVIPTLSGLLLLSNLLLCQSGDYDFYFEHLNKSLFPLDDLMRLDIKSVNCASYTISIRNGHKSDSLESYSILFNERFEPINETRIIDKEKAEITYEYMGSIQKVTKRFGMYSTDSSDIFNLFNSVTEIYSEGLKRSSVTNFYKNWYVGGGNFILMDTILYNSFGLPEKTMQLWINKENYLDVDTLLAFFGYDSLNRLIEYQLKPADGFSNPIKFNYGCVTPFLKHSVYKYAEEGTEKCEYNADLSSDSLKLYGVAWCEKSLLLSDELMVIETEKNRNKRYLIKLMENGAMNEINSDRIKKITYLKDSKLPRDLTVIDDDTIIVYIFSYQ